MSVATEAENPPFNITGLPLIDDDFVVVMILLYFWFITAIEYWGLKAMGGSATFGQTLTVNSYVLLTFLPLYMKINNAFVAISIGSKIHEQPAFVSAILYIYASFIGIYKIKMLALFHWISAGRVLVAKLLGWGPVVVFTLGLLNML